MTSPSPASTEPPTLAGTASAWAKLPLLAAAALGAATLIGWLFDLPALRRPWAGSIGMSPVTASALCGAALAPFLLADSTASIVRRWGGRLLAAGLVLLGAVRLLRYFSLTDLDVELALQSLGGRGFDPGQTARVAPATGLGFLLFGTAALLFDRRARGARLAAGAACVAVGLIGLVGLLGHAYGAASVHGPMALNTALAFVALAAGSLALAPDSGPWGWILGRSPGGVLTRRLVPTLGAVLFALGALLLVGVHRGRFGVETGTALLVAASSTVLAAAVAFVGRALDRAAETRRLADERVRASEARFRAIAETASDGIVVADVRGAVTYLNAAALRIFGRTETQALGRSVTQFMPERYHEAHLQGLERFAATGEGRLIGRTVELAGLRADGEEFPLELSLASWRSGGEIFVAALLRDVTVRRRAEEDLQRHAAQLEISNAELDAFSYSVSHDLRAPLRAIDGFSLALIEDFGRQLDEKGADYLRRVRTAAQRMSQLIDDLIDLSRVSRAEMKREPVDLTAIAREVEQELRRREPGREVEVEVDPDLSVEGDSRLLRLALENLLGNAWKYTRTRPRARIELARVQYEGRPGFEVRDNGVGFDMAAANRLFGAFQRLHRADEFEGTGIGLATVQRIVRRHGGRVWASAVKDRGATFGFTL